MNVRIQFTTFDKEPERENKGHEVALICEYWRKSMEVIQRLSLFETFFSWTDLSVATHLGKPSLVSLTQQARSHSTNQKAFTNFVPVI